MRYTLLYIVLLVAAALPLSLRAQEAQPEVCAWHRPTFAWGAQVGGSIDLSGHNMSSVDFSGTLGLRYRWIKLLGVGFGANVMASNDARSYPITLNFRTDFLSHHRGLLFLDTRVGCSINEYPGDASQTGAYTFVGGGIHLATGRIFASYISLGYTFVQRGDVRHPLPDGATATTRLPHLHLATASLGITF